MGFNEKIIVSFGRGLDAILQAGVYRIVGVKCQNDRCKITELTSLNKFGRSDDDLIAHLAGTRGRPIENTTARSCFSENDLGADPSAGILVPDIDKFKGINARRFAMFWVQGNRAVVIKIGTGDSDPM